MTSVDGNVTLRLDVVDAGDNDEVGFTVLSSKTSNLYYSNQWMLVGRVWKTVTQPLETGGVTIS